MSQTTHPSDGSEACSNRSKLNAFRVGHRGAQPRRLRGLSVAWARPPSNARWPPRSLIASSGSGAGDRDVPWFIGRATWQPERDRRCPVLPLGSLAVSATSCSVTPAWLCCPCTASGPNPDRRRASSAERRVGRWWKLLLTPSSLGSRADRSSGLLRLAGNGALSGPASATVGGAHQPSGQKSGNLTGSAAKY